MWTPNPAPSRRWHRLSAAVLLLAVAALLALGAAPVSATAATWVTGSGHAASDTRRLGDFDRIEVGSGIDLVVRQAGADAQVMLTADDNVLPLIVSMVEEGASGRTLKLGFARQHLIRTRSPVKAVVDAVRLRAIVATGSGDIHVERFDTPSLSLSINGSSDARLDALRTDALSIAVSGSGDVKAAGRAARVRLAISGSGDADLAALEADDVDVDIAGSGDAQVHARQSLKVAIAGSGDVTYRGGAPRVTSSVAGSGSVTAR